MTTQAWSTVVDHSTDAGFRAWGSELSGKFAAAGLVQTSDTGQINWTIVTRGSINTEAGYEIWRMNDSQQSTSPVFFRIGYGTSGATPNPRIQITVGTGSNGSGTITGTAITSARSINGTGAPTSTSTAYNSYLCVTDGFFGLSWKAGANGSANSGCRGSFFFQRTSDTSGVPDSEGCMVIWGSGITSGFTGYQYLRFSSTASPGTFINTGGFPCYVYGLVSSSLVGSNNQAYLHMTATPGVRACFGTCTVLFTEVPAGNTFTFIPIASTSHTYIGLGNVQCADTTTSSSYTIAMLWE